MGNLEVLPPEGDADDGDAVEQSNQAIEQSVDPAKEYGPDEVEDGLKAGWLDLGDLLPEWPDDEAGELEQLDPDGDADDGDAP